MSDFPSVISTDRASIVPLSLTMSSSWGKSESFRLNNSCALKNSLSPKSTMVYVCRSRNTVPLTRRMRSRRTWWGFRAMLPFTTWLCSNFFFNHASPSMRSTNASRFHVGQLKETRHAVGTISRDAR
eukprot:Pompholyxophrys_punicea_v1_NODE_572_length_1672_cov_2.459493.p3 type:complete len:127 gc:universal NODE_572_length_1672_cov_2.459493:586-966(+)